MTARRTRKQADDDKLPPHDYEAEKGILGCILVDPDASRTVMSDCINLLRAGPAVFYDLRNRNIYDALLGLFDDGEAIDVITLQSRLAAFGQLEECGGIQFLSTLPDAVPSSSNLEYYVNIVREKHMLREVLQTCRTIMERATDVSGNGQTFLTDSEAEMLNIRSRIAATNTFVNIQDAQSALIEQYEAAYAGNGAVGILSGFADLDRLCGGMMEQEMIIVAGRPSSGKTTLCMNIAWNVARRGTKVGICSLETSGKKLVHRFICMAGEVSGVKLLRGTGAQEDYAKAAAGGLTVNTVRDMLMISDSEGTRPNEIMAKCRRMQQLGAKLFIIDYMQLIDAQARSETERASEQSKFCKRLAKSLNAPVIVISSLNRDGYGKSKSGEKKAPGLENLRNSGQIEFDADKAILLYHENDEAMTENTESSTVLCKVAKQKDGPLGTFPLTFLPKHFKMLSQINAEVPPMPNSEPPEPPIVQDMFNP